MVARGDLAWTQGARGDARRDWRLAATSPDPAAAAMARLRLLRVSGNLGLMVHGPRADRLLARCPVDDPWCGLARVDRDLLLTELGLADRAAAAARRAAELAPVLPAAAHLRRTWAGAPAGALPPPSERAAPAPAGPPAGPPVDPGDAAWLPAAQAAARAGGVPRGPGTWTLGLGVIGAAGLGAGPLLRLHHPDLAWRAWTLEAEGWATTAGAWRARAGLRTRGPAWLLVGAAGGRQLVPVYQPDGAWLGTGVVGEAQLRAAPGLQRGPVAAWVGPLARVDRPAGGAWIPGHGLFGGIAVAGAGPAPSRLTLAAEGALAGPAHLAITGDSRTTTPLAGGTAALRLVAVGTPLSTSPTWRRPAWGGGEVLRGAPLGRLRAPWMAAVVPEWRRPLVGPLGLAVFGEAAWARGDDQDGLHAGGGMGLRLHLPPRPHNTVRLDLAAGTLGVGLSAGWGEAF